MNNSAVGAAIIALCLGAVGWAVSLFGFDFSGALSVGIGLFVAAIAWILLWMGLGEDRRGKGVDASDLNAGAGSAPTSAASTASSVSTSAPAAAAPAVAAAAPAAVAPAAAAAAPAAPAAEAKSPAKKPAAKKPAAKTAAKSAAKPAAKATKPAAKAEKPAPKAEKPAAKPVAPDGKPEMLTKPRAGGADDLKQIKGVGPKLEKMLNTMGVYHFDQVASWRKKEVEWVDENLEGFKGRVSRDNWVSQAKVLAKGGKTEFSEKVKKGGVY